MKTLLATSALAFGLAMTAPAMAQDTAAPSTASPATSAPAPAADPAPATSGDAMGAATGATPATGATAAQEPAAGAMSTQSADAASATPSNSSAQISAVVEAGFPKYDTDGSGELSQAEFKQWVSDLKTQEMAASGQALDAAQADQYASRALRVADADGNKAVTRDELTTFLGG